MKNNLFYKHIKNMFESNVIDELILKNSKLYDNINFKKTLDYLIDTETIKYINGNKLKWVKENNNNGYDELMGAIKLFLNENDSKSVLTHPDYYEGTDNIQILNDVLGNKANPFIELIRKGIVKSDFVINTIANL